VSETRKGYIKAYGVSETGRISIPVFNVLLFTASNVKAAEPMKLND
jgi:hypothetical protein